MRVRQQDRSVLAAGAVLAVGMALAGCGGSGDDVAAARAEGAAQARLEERTKSQAEETARLRREVERLKSPRTTQRSTTTVVERPTTPVPTGSGSGTIRTASSGTTRWPAWTVQLGSFTGRSGAEATAARARANGLPDVGILNSSEHSSLRAGYWMVYSGSTSQATAQGAVGRARSAGFSDALARFVSGG